MDHEITVFSSQDTLPSLNLDAEAITPEYYIEHYIEFLPRYISNGRPSKDTLVTYREGIEHFKRWCHANNRTPLAVGDYQMRMYMEALYKVYKDSSIVRMFAAIRAFFMVARRIGLIEISPCEYIRVSKSSIWEEGFRYYSNEQIQEVCDVFNSMADPFIRYRNLLILHLLAVEGMRRVEVHRMNDEDVNMEMRSLLVRGKGHNGIIYPSDATFEVLQLYWQHRPYSEKEGMLTPTVVSDHRHHYKRISRDGLVRIMNSALEQCNLKHKGFACHIMRHSCGTNLYQETKDLRVVQDQLRHRDPKMTAKYAHVQERMSHRYTQKLAPKI